MIFVDSGPETYKLSSLIMAAYEWLLVDLLIFIYNLTWLVFLTRKHYGEVTTTAGHIFELNVLLTSTIYIFSLIIFVDLEVLPFGIMTQIIDTANQYSFFMAIAGSQIETAVFLKTLNVNTMMTNTARKIILVMMIIRLHSNNTRKFLSYSYSRNC